MEGGSRIAVDQQEQAKAVVTTVVKRHDHVDVRLVGANVDAEAGEATAASVAPPDTNDPVGDATVSNKRTHEEGEDEVMLEKSRQCKRVARGNDESVAPSSAAQTSDETVGDSSEDVEMSEPLDEEEAIRNSAAHASEEEKRAHEEFCSQLTEKQQVDVFDVRTRQWLAAKIDHIDNDSYTVHYMGWNSKCDERIEKIKNYRLMPRATKAVKAWVKHRAKINKNRRAKQEKLAAPPTPPLEDHLAKETQASELAPTFVQTGLTRSGRAITQRISNGSLKKPAKSVGKKSLTAVESKFPEEDLCGICGEIEDDNLTDMIMCDGGCLKSHHFSCLGIESAPDDEQWLCEQCRTNEQLCFACGRNGTINEKGGVFRCSVASCGKFFHQACIDANKMSRRADEKERRLLEHAKKSPEDKNMYIMELGKGEYIDARFKGSVSRFINHSCDPNCHLLKWRVKGVNRIAITALKDIESGTELSYDYQFHTKQAMEWKCHCKAKNCRGTMAPEKINQPNDSPVKKLTKKEKLKQRKRALIQEKIQNEKEAKSTARRLSLTANVSTGDRTTADKMAARSGPATRELQWAKYYRLFHMRDAKCGFNFKLRKELRDQRIGALERVKREELSVSGSTTAASSRSVSPVRLIELTEAKNDPVGKGTEKGATEASAIKEDPVIK
ncbi:hypothetical protein BBO99_00000957 [Phytophthora kernoviae]|uniref:Histone-lysine N-methyltransferase n=2 Tax=Phytophthora kernoviae TaxID=325452 RepID=A0A421FD92_9STRA|nr:hypothetical protein G195_008085 [Phytophthora kernoviae 00238/432]KAG2531680.1 hypothetical protein JM16_000713 [Phytophthora kernoviae]KAG2532979.1 hypothetical protein JM18_000795 [Phytophthora kernoviae]RLN37746.1 hypothetical protein BBI17_000859 [Phytophthora kernoviae]RLN84904.1 hypothetical protein BBO99_00000957 [Phytophthora kernoviae]